MNSFTSLRFLILASFAFVASIHFAFANCSCICENSVSVPRCDNDIDSPPDCSLNICQLQQPIHGIPRTNTYHLEQIRVPEADLWGQVGDPDPHGIRNAYPTRWK